MLNAPTFQSAWVKPRWSLSGLGFKKPKKPFDWKKRLFCLGITFITFGGICLLARNYYELAHVCRYLLQILVLDIIFWLGFDWYQ